MSLGFFVTVDQDGHTQVIVVSLLKDEDQVHCCVCVCLCVCMCDCVCVGVSGRPDVLARASMQCCVVYDYLMNVSVQITACRMCLLLTTECVCITSY